MGREQVARRPGTSLKMGKHLTTTGPDSREHRLLHSSGGTGSHWCPKHSREDTGKCDPYSP